MSDVTAGDVTASDAIEGASPIVAAKPPSVTRVALRLWRTRVGVLLAGAMALIALCGRWFAPFGEQEFVGKAHQWPGELLQESGTDTVFGTGDLGYDVWTRFLYGGRPVLIAAVAATALALVVGSLVGLLAAYDRGKLDTVLMRIMDVILSLPQVIMSLVLISIFGASLKLIVFTVGITTVPRIARVVRGAAVSVVERDFVSAAEALGESRWRIIRSELLPNVTSPLLVEANLRLTFAISLIAGLGFLGFVSDPGAANWGLMIDEHRGKLRGWDQPWGSVLPIIAIALLTVGTGLIADGISRASAGIDRGRAPE